MLSTLIHLLGLLSLLRLTHALLSPILRRALPSSLARYSSDPPTWAIVTGSTSGIGLHTARHLLARGFDVLLHGRSPENLARAQAALRVEFPRREVRGVALDAAAAEVDAGERFAAALPRGARVSVLVNMVGVGHDPARDFAPLAGQGAGAVERVVRVNVRFATLLTRSLLPWLVEAGAERSLVVNAGSLASLGLPYMGVYSGTKGYLEAWSRSLAAEMRGEAGRGRVDVVCVQIGDTDSAGHRVGEGWFTPSAAEMGRMVVGCVGRRGEGVVRVPYWRHALQKWLCEVQPEWMLQMGMLENLKKHAEKVE